MNKRMLRIAFLDVKMMMKSIIYIGGISAAVLFLILWMIRRPQNFNTDSYMYMFFEVMKYVFIISGVLVLGKDYRNGTYKYVFSGAMTRNQIIIEKLLALAVFGLVCGMVQTVIRTVVSFILNKGIHMSNLFSVNILYEIWLYIIFSLLTGCFGMMVLSISKKIIISFVSTITFFGILQFYSAIYMILLTRAESLMVWQKAIFFTPTYIIWKWMLQTTPTFVENLLMLLYITLMTVITMIVINRKDMNVGQ